MPGVLLATMKGCAVVLGAGGHAASSWEIGFVAGMADCGIDVRAAELLVGTSAGARVAVQLSSAIPLEDLIRQQTDPEHQMSEVPQGIDWKKWRIEIEHLKQDGDNPAEILRRIGSMVSQKPWASSLDRRRFIASQLPLRTWPQRKLSIVAVEVESGERRVFDSTSGIELIDAVMASGALPGIWPPIPFRRRSYFDGGLYSTDNASVAVGFKRVLVLTLRPATPPLSVISLEVGLQALRNSGARVEVVHPDETTERILAAVGGNVLDSSVREPMLRSGRTQGRRSVNERLMAWLSQE